MALRYRIPLPGPFYYSGCVGPRRWLPRDSHTGSGPIGFTVKWFIVYPGIAIFGAGLVIMLAPSFAAEPPEVPAGRSVFPCSASCPAIVWFCSYSAAGSACPLRFRLGSTGACGCRGWTVWLGSVCVSWGVCSSGLGESLLLDWHRILRFVIAWDGGCGHVRPHHPSAFHGVPG